MPKAQGQLPLTQAFHARPADGQHRVAGNSETVKLGPAHPWSGRKWKVEGR